VERVVDNFKEERLNKLKLLLVTALIAAGVLVASLVSTGASHDAPSVPSCAAEVCALDTTPNDSLYPQQYGPQRVQAPAAWDLSTGASTTIIATVDTGIDCTHPDLANKCVPGYDFVHNVPLAGTENSDDHGHGTHVTSIEAGVTNNGIGVAGLCWECRYLPVKVLNASGSGSWAQVAAGIRFAADNGANVINMSLGGSSFDSGVRSAVDYAFSKNVLVVSACGNSGSEPCLYPAAYVNSMAISCSDASDALCSFTSRGVEVDVSAPGLSVLAAVPIGSCALCDPSGYRKLSGTSMSTPHVSGVAGLVRSLHPEYTADQVYGLLELSADDRGPVGFDHGYGFGRLNAYRALTTAAPDGRLPKSDDTPTPYPKPEPTSTPIPVRVAITKPNEGDTVRRPIKVCMKVSSLDTISLARFTFINNGLTQQFTLNNPHVGILCKNLNVNAKIFATGPAVIRGRACTPRVCAEDEINVSYIK